MKLGIMEVELGDKMCIEVDNSLVMFKSRHNQMSLGVAITGKDGGIVNPLTQSVKIKPSNLWEITNVDRVNILRDGNSVLINVMGDNRIKHAITIDNDNVDDVGISVFARTPSFNKSKSFILRSV